MLNKYINLSNLLNRIISMYNYQKIYIYIVFIYLLEFIRYTKYLLYFIIFINCFTINFIYYKISNNFNDRLIKLLYYSINLNGCGLIKFVQWTNSHYKILSKNNTLLNKLFNNFYENCNIHHIEYTKKIFREEYLLELDDIFRIDSDGIIKSGSIAQTYKCYLNNNKYIKTINKNNIINKNNTIDKDYVFAVKIVHPELKYQIFWIKSIVNVYCLLTSNIKFLNNYKIPFDNVNYFNNLKKQFSMINEYNNLIYYYNHYKDNDYIVIPEPLFASENILIMKYEEGLCIDNTEDSLYVKNKIFVLLNCFIKTNYFDCDIIHNDMHNGNWKYRKYKDFYQLIIYDFGYCSKNIANNNSRLFIYSMDNDLYDNILSITYMYIKNSNITKEEFISKGVQFLNDNRSTSIVGSPDRYSSNIQYILLYIIKYNYSMNNFIIETMINFILLKQHFDIFITIDKHKNKSNQIYTNMSSNMYSNINSSPADAMLYKIICKKYNIFSNIVDYYNEYYIDNKLFKMKHIENNYLENLNNNSNNSISI